MGEIPSRPVDEPTGPVRVVDADLSCAECGYNLRMLPIHGRCPECGAAVETSLVAPEGVVNTDIACFSCGYNLRTLPLAGLCPECGAPVNRSLHGDLLRYADHGWVRRLLPDVGEGSAS